jgi:hypothetical protein
MTDQTLVEVKPGKVPHADDARGASVRPDLQRPRYVDPAAEVMSHNPNLSPPIHPHRE